MNRIEWQVGNHHAHGEDFNANVIADPLGNPILIVHGLPQGKTVQELVQSIKDGECLPGVRDGLSVAFQVAALPDLLAAVRSTLKEMNGVGWTAKDALREALAKADRLEELLKCE